MDKEIECIEWANFLNVGQRHYCGWPLDRDVGELTLLVPDKSLGRKIGRADYGPEDKNAPPEGIVSAYHQGADVHAIAGVGEENFVAVKNRDGQRDGHAVFWRKERERGETFAADAERVAALTAEVQRAAVTREAERQRRQEYINAHPWPNRVVLGGEFYKYLWTRTLPLTALGGQLGAVRRLVGTDGAYPADFQWRDGDATLVPEGAPLRAIKGVDSRYYIAAVMMHTVPGREHADIYVNEKRRSDQATAALRELLLALPEEK